MATSLVGMAQSLASSCSVPTSCPLSSRQARMTSSSAALCSVGVRAQNASSARLLLPEAASLPATATAGCALRTVKH